MVKNISNIKIILSLFTIISIIILSNCYDKHNNRYLCLELNSNVEKLLLDYAKQHSHFNTFIIKYYPKQIVSDTIILESGYLVGPGYNELLKDYLSNIYFDLNEIRVYYISDMSSLFKLSIKDNWINLNPLDSITLLSDNQKLIIKDVNEVFIHKAIFFNYDVNGELKINYRPDTLLAPRYLGVKIKFKNINDTIE